MGSTTRISIKIVDSLTGFEGGDGSYSVGGLVVVGNLSSSMAYSFLILWCTQYLRMPLTVVGLTFGASGTLAAGAAYLGGLASDRNFRLELVTLPRMVITTWFVVAALTRTPLIGIVTVFLTLVAISFSGTCEQVFGLIVLKGFELEPTIAYLRTCQNIGFLLGPILGSGLLIYFGWRGFFFGLAALTLSSSIAVSVIGRGHSPDDFGGSENRPTHWKRHFSLSAIRAILPSALALIGYFSFEVILPVSLVRSHGYSVASWGFLSFINPLMVIFLQMRITRASQRWTLRNRLAVGALLLGPPLAMIRLNASPLMIVSVIATFAMGEMLWGPSAQAALIQVFGTRDRGAAIGMLRVANSLAYLVAVSCLLPLWPRIGDGLIWLIIASVGSLSSLMYFRWLRIDLVVDHSASNLNDERG